MSLSGVPVVNLLYKATQGLESAWGSNTTLTVNAGQTRDSTNTYDMVLSQQTTLNAATTGLNGLDTGTLTTTRMYYLFLISDPQTGNPTGLLLSLSAVPLMPLGYGAYKVIGYWATDGSSHFLLGYNSGSYQKRKFFYDTARTTSVTAGAATTLTNVSLANLVPAIDNMIVHTYLTFVPGAAGRTLAAQAPGSTGSGTGNIMSGQVTAVIMTDTVDVLSKLVTAVPNIAYKVSNSGDTAAISVSGFDYEV